MQAAEYDSCCLQWLWQMRRKAWAGTGRHDWETCGKLTVSSVGQEMAACFTAWVPGSATAKQSAKLNSNSHSRKLHLLAEGFLVLCIWNLTLLWKEESTRKKQNSKQLSSLMGSAYYRKTWSPDFLLSLSAPRLHSNLSVFSITPLESRSSHALLPYGHKASPEALPLLCKALRPLPSRMSLSLAEATTSPKVSEGATQLFMVQHS